MKFRNARCHQRHGEWYVTLDRPRRRARGAPRSPAPAAAPAVDVKAYFGDKLQGEPMHLAPSFDPVSRTWFIELAGQELEAPTLAELRIKLPAGVTLDCGGP